MGTFNYIVTERSIINLANVEEQHNAFKSLMSLLPIGGQYLMVESFIEGLDRTNALRSILDLPPIDSPWHNVFLSEKVVSQWETEEYKLKKTIPLSTTYHFLSRVVYAKLAADKNETLRYDSDINRLSLKLPLIGDFGPVRMWIWSRVK